MKHKVQDIHFVGIGGSGMSGIAEVLLNLGYIVSGSDIGSNPATRRLAELGAQIYIGHDAAYIGKAQAVVTSSAVKDDNPEVIAARAKHVPIVPRAVMLAELMRLKRGIAIAGTHGKTTTTSLVASVLAQGGFDPTFVIGGRLNKAGANAKLGAGEYIVAEADESDASFLNLVPMIAVITNIDADHMETYEHDFAKLKQAFIDFTRRLPFYGLAVLCIDDPHVAEIIPLVTKPVITYGFHPQAEVRAVNATAVGEYMHFTVLQEGYPPLAISLNQPGMHNVQNACAAVAIAREVGVADHSTQTALFEFHGVGRRFTRHSRLRVPAHITPIGHSDHSVHSAHSMHTMHNERAEGFFDLVDDYGHHPAEAAATIAAARGAYPGRRLVLAFQPHRYTRTRDCFEDFVKVLSHADALLLAEVYSAGETPIVAADGRALAHALRVRGDVEPIFVERMDDMPATIMHFVRDGDVVITMGAGSMGAVVPKLLTLLTGENA